MTGEQFSKIANIIANCNDIGDDEKGKLIGEVYSCASGIAEEYCHYDLVHELDNAFHPFIRKYKIEPDYTYYRYDCDESDFEADKE